MGCLHDPANVQQTSKKCIQNTRANAGRLLNRAICNVKQFAKCYKLRSLTRNAIWYKTIKITD